MCLNNQGSARAQRENLTGRVTPRLLLCREIYGAPKKPKYFGDYCSARKFRFLAQIESFLRRYVLGQHLPNILLMRGVSTGAKRPRESRHTCGQNQQKLACASTVNINCFWLCKFRPWANTRFVYTQKLNIPGKKGGNSQSTGIWDYEWFEILQIASFKRGNTQPKNLFVKLQKNPTL